MSSFALSLLPLVGLGAPLAGDAPLPQLCNAYTDMTEPSEVVPLDWQGKAFRFPWIAHGRLSMGNDPKGFDRILPWSVVVAAPDNRLPTARVQLRDLRLYMRSKRTGEWRELSMPRKWDGSHFAHELKGRKFDKLEVERDGRVSTLVADERYFAHFWPAQGRRRFDPDDVGGVLVTMQARMPREDYEAGGRYLINAAADYWGQADGGFDDYKTNGDAGIGRLKSLTPDWRSVSMTTVPTTELGTTCP